MAEAPETRPLRFEGRKKLTVVSSIESREEEEGSQDRSILPTKGGKREDLSTLAKRREVAQSLHILL